MHALVKFHEYIPYDLGVMARTRFTIWNSRGNNSKTKNAGVVFLVHDTSSYCDVCTCEVSRIYSVRFWSYGPDTKVGRTDGQIGGGIKNARVVFLVHDTSA